MNPAAIIFKLACSMHPNDTAAELKVIPQKLKTSKRTKPSFSGIVENGYDTILFFLNLSLCQQNKMFFAEGHETRSHFVQFLPEDTLTR